MSVKVSGNPTRQEAQDIAGIWETGLWNNHVHADRFMLGDDTAAYLFKVRINLLSILKGHLKSFGSLTVLFQSCTPEVNVYIYISTKFFIVGSNTNESDSVITPKNLQ